MKSYQNLASKTLWLGTFGVAAMLLGWTPSCKAQEVSPAIFTSTGVEDIYPAQKPMAKKAANVQTVAHVVGANSNQAVGRTPKARPATRKQVAVSAPGL